MDRVASLPSPLLLPFVLALPAAAAACSLCSTAVIEQVVPPAIPWAVIGPLWYFTLAVVGAAFGRRIPFVEGVGMTLAIYFLGGLFAAAYAGAVIPALLVLPALAGTVLALLPPRNRAVGAVGRRSGAQKSAIAIVGAIGLAATVITGAEWTNRQRARSDVDILLRWDGTGIQLSMENRLRRLGSASIPQWREVLARSNGSGVLSAVEELAKHGDPSIDVPLLIDALERTGNSGQWPVSSLEKWLAEISGIAAPAGTGATEWRRLWAEKNAAAPPVARP